MMTLTWSDAENLVRPLLQEWFDVEAKCIDWKKKTSHKGKGNQDFWKVFDILVNDNNRITHGIQVKYWKKPVPKSLIKEWAEEVKAVNFDYNYAYLIEIRKGTEMLFVHRAKNYLK